jgi:hypothetical protein
VFPRWVVIATEVVGFCVLSVLVGPWFLGLVQPARAQAGAFGAVWSIVFFLLAFIVIPAVLVSVVTGPLRRGRNRNRNRL